MTPTHVSGPSPAEELARAVEAIVLEAARKAADEVRIEDGRWQRGAEIVLSENVEPADCCPNNLATGMVVRAVDRSLVRSETIRRIRPDRSVRIVPVEHCPFCGVRYHPEANP